MYHVALRLDGLYSGGYAEQAACITLARSETVTRCGCRRYGGHNEVRGSQITNTLSNERTRSPFPRTSPVSNVGQNRP